MKKLVLSLMVCVSFVSAGQLSADLKQVAKDGITAAGYRCDIVTSAYKKWNDDIKVVCDDYSAIFIIKKYGGNWTIEVEK